MGHCHFFETNQSRLCATMNSDQVKQTSGQHVYTVTCGQMTPKQKKTVHLRPVIDVQRYTAMFDWFIKKSCHHGFGQFTPSKKCPAPEFIKDACHGNNIDDSVNQDVENVFGNLSFYSLSAQNLSCRTSVYEKEEHFSTSIIGGKKPTCLAYG